MVIDGVQTGPVPGVPHAYGVVPTSRGEQVRYLGVPHQTTYWSCVSTQDVNAGVLCVVPNTHRPATHTHTLQNRSISDSSFSDVIITNESPVVRAAAQDSLSERRPAHVEHFGRVSSKHLQRLIRACSQVVDSYVFILTSGRNHVSETEGERKKRMR